MMLHPYILVLLCCTTMIHGFPRHRRQLNQLKGNPVQFNGRTSWASNPSGSYPGTYYYGVGSDPNYGSFIKPPNRPGHNILPISYDPDSSLSSYLINSNRLPTFQQSQQQYPFNHVWQKPNRYGYSDRPNNNYPPGTLGWYATGGNYWYHNKAQSLRFQTCLLMLSISLLIFNR